MNIINSEIYVFNSSYDVIWLYYVYNNTTVLVDSIRRIRDLKAKVWKYGTDPLENFGGQVEGVDLWVGRVYLWCRLRLVLPIDG